MQCLISIFHCRYTKDNRLKSINVLWNFLELKIQLLQKHMYLQHSSQYKRLHCWLSVFLFIRHNVTCQEILYTDCQRHQVVCGTTWQHLMYAQQQILLLYCESGYFYLCKHANLVSCHFRVLSFVILRMLRIKQYW